MSTIPADIAFAQKASVIVKAAGFDPRTMDLELFLNVVHEVIVNAHKAIYKEPLLELILDAASFDDKVCNCQHVIDDLARRTNNVALSNVTGLNVMLKGHYEIGIVVGVLFAEGQRLWLANQKSLAHNDSKKQRSSGKGKRAKAKIMPTHANPPRVSVAALDVLVQKIDTLESRLNPDLEKYSDRAGLDIAIPTTYGKKDLAHRNPTFPNPLPKPSRPSSAPVQRSKRYSDAVFQRLYNYAIVESTPKATIEEKRVIREDPEFTYDLESGRRISIVESQLRKQREEKKAEAEIKVSKLRDVCRDGTEDAVGIPNRIKQSIDEWVAKAKKEREESFDPSRNTIRSMKYESYENLSPSDLLISVEYCHSCATHGISLRHNANDYIRCADDMLRVLAQSCRDFNPCVRLGVTRFRANIAPSIVIGGNVDHECRIGALEIQAAYRSDDGRLHVEIIHSKLHSGHWPGKSVIVKKFMLFCSHAGVANCSMPSSILFQGTDGLAPYSNDTWQSFLSARSWEFPAVETCLDRLDVDHGVLYLFDYRQTNALTHCLTKSAAPSEMKEINSWKGKVSEERKGKSMTKDKPLPSMSSSATSSRPQKNSSKRDKTSRASDVRQVKTTSVDLSTVDATRLKSPDHPEKTDVHSSNSQATRLNGKDESSTEGLGSDRSVLPATYESFGVPAIPVENIDNECQAVCPDLENTLAQRVHTFHNSYDMLGRFALTQLYENLGGEEWLGSWNWNSDTPLSQWRGIECNPNHGDAEVKGLTLNSVGLRGPLPQNMNDLATLTVLDLSNNEISGQLPTSLHRLKELKLACNKFCLEIPIEFSQYVKINTIDLSHNQLRGKLPGCFGSLSSLISLRLHGNDFTGPLPLSLGKLTNLKEFTSDLFPYADVQMLWRWLKPQHSFSWPDQKHATKLASTQCHDVQNVALLSLFGSVDRYQFDDGDDDSAIFEGLEDDDDDDLFAILDSIEKKDVHLMKQSEPVSMPPSAASNFTFNSWQGWNEESKGHGEWMGVSVDSIGSIQSIVLQRAKLTGCLPTELSSLQRLVFLDLSNNKLSGAIPQEYSRLISIRCLFLNGNSLTSAAWDTLSLLPRLEIVDISSNLIEEIIMPTAATFPPALREFYCSKNNIQGSLTNLISISSLNVLDLSSNDLTEQFASITCASQIVRLNLSSNPNLRGSLIRNNNFSEINTSNTGCTLD